MVEILSVTICFFVWTIFTVIIALLCCCMGWRYQLISIIHPVLEFVFFPFLVRPVIPILAILLVQGCDPQGCSDVAVIDIGVCCTKWWLMHPGHNARSRSAMVKRRREGRVIANWTVIKIHNEWRETLDLCRRLTRAIFGQKTNLMQWVARSGGQERKRQKWLSQ